jgi:hypothetical protein
MKNSVPRARHRGRERVETREGFELENVASCRSGDALPIKGTLLSPTQFPAISFKRGVTDKVYPDHAALLSDVVEIMTADLSELSTQGASYIQLDAPRYSYYMDPKWRLVDQGQIGTDKRPLRPVVRFALATGTLNTGRLIVTDLDRHPIGLLPVGYHSDKTRCPAGIRHHPSDAGRARRVGCAIDSQVLTGRFSLKYS